MSSVEIVRARRTCAVPQQLLRSYELPNIPNTRAVPKRYEETKPVMVQNFTHQRIMGMKHQSDYDIGLSWLGFTTPCLILVYRCLTKLGVN